MKKVTRMRDAALVEGILAVGDLFGTRQDDSSRDPGLAGYFAAVARDFAAAKADLAWSFRQESARNERAKQAS